MRPLPLLFLFFGLSVSAQKIQGHWSAVSTGDSLLTMEDLLHSGTVTFEKVKKNTRKTYQWGGGLYTGLEFAQNGEFIFYNNVLCSSESSPVSNSGETWEMSDANTIAIKGKEKICRARIISVNASKLTLLFFP